MSEVPEKKEKSGGVADTIKRAFTPKKEKEEEEKVVKAEEKVVKADVPAKTPEAPKGKPMDEAPSETAAKMVDGGGVTLEEANPEMHRKHVTVLSQKAPGARKYFRSK